MSDNLYYLQLTVYQYDRKKIKMDYSCIPVEIISMINNKPTSLKSEVSDEVIDINKMKFYNSKELIGSLSEKKEEGKAVKTSILVKSIDGLEDEEMMKLYLLKKFFSRWRLRRSYIKFLKKKISLRQI